MSAEEKIEAIKNLLKDYRSFEEWSCLLDLVISIETVVNS